MENFFPFKHLTEIENMMVNIRVEGKQIIWQGIEEESNAIKRCELRKLYTLAINKIEKG